MSPAKRIGAGFHAPLVLPQLVLNPPATMQLVGTTGVRKISDQSNWTGNSKSSVGFSNSCVFTCTIVAGQYLMFGLNSDPDAGGNFTRIDYAFYAANGGVSTAYESGSSVSVAVGTYNTSTVFSMEYTGGNIVYKANGSTYRTIARSGSGPLFFDTSFYDAGAEIANWTMSGT